MESFSSSIFETIRLHSEWAWLVVFLIAFAESLAIIGLMVPGWIILVGIGTLIGGNVLPFYPIVISAYFGAVLGEYLSYFLGYRYHENLVQLRLFRKHQKLLEQSRVYFKRYGNAGVFFGRFIGPLRAVLPFVAGVFQMPPSKFHLINLTSGLIWAPLYLTPGILAGAAYNLDKETSIEVGFIFLLIFVMSWYVFNQGKKLSKGIKNNSKNLTEKINFALSVSILIVSLFIFSQSSYYSFVIEIVNVLAQQ